MGFLHFLSFLNYNSAFLSSHLLLFYTDPGSGAMVWQLLAASFVGLTFYISFAFRRIKLFFGKLSGQASPKDVQQDASRPVSKITL